MSTSTPTRRDNLHAVYMNVVQNWAQYVSDIVKDTGLTKEQVASLLGTLERKGILASEHVNGETRKIWQSYFDIENEQNVIENAEAKFAETFPGDVADAKTPAQVDKHTPADGEVIYTVKRTRSTGARVVLHNSVQDGKRAYVATCETHGNSHVFPRRLPAESMCHHPEQWCADCQVIDTTNGHERTANELEPRYVVMPVSVGAAGLTQRPAVIDTHEGRTVKVFQGKNGEANAAKHAAKLNG